MEILLKVLSHFAPAVLSGIQPHELCQLGAMLSLVYCGSLDPDHILYGLLDGSSDACQKIVKSRCPFVPAVQNLNLARLGIHASVWTNYRRNAEYCENTSLHIFIPRTSARPVGVSFPPTAWVKLNCLHTGVG